MSCIPSSVGGWRWFSSTMIFSALLQKVGAHPTEDVRTMPPPAVTSLASTTAQCTGPRKDLAAGRRIGRLINVVHGEQGGRGAMVQLDNDLLRLAAERGRATDRRCENDAATRGDIVLTS